MGHPSPCGRLPVLAPMRPAPASASCPVPRRLFGTNVRGLRRPACAGMPPLRPADAARARGTGPPRAPGIRTAARGNYANKTGWPYLRFILKNSANREAGPRRLGLALILLYPLISVGAIPAENGNVMPDVMQRPPPL